MVLFDTPPYPYRKKTTPKVSESSFESKKIFLGNPQKS